MRWLVVSAALSVVLTALLNIGLRTFRGAGNRVVGRLAESTSPIVDDGHDRRVRVLLPWKAMVAASVILTVVVNIVLRVF